MKLLQLTILIILSLVMSPVESVGQNSKTGTGAAASQPGSLRGRVKAQKGRPMAGVTVRATASGRQYETTSNAQGDFVFSELAPDEYVLAFVKSGYKTFTTRSLTVAPGETVRLSRLIEMAPDGPPYSVIRGAVLHGAGFTLPNALVALERIDGRRKLKMETLSLEGGEFAFRLRAEPATYRITAKAAGFESASLEMTIENDEVRNIVLNLKRLP
jgi:hypothetical protein